MKLLWIAPAALLASCAGVSSTPKPYLPAVDVTASGETSPVGTANADAADDPAIWRNPANPAASLIVGTDKKAGLYSYGLDGRTRDFVAAGRLNNVDLIGDREGAFVAASDRTDKANSRIALFDLAPDGKLTSLGTVNSGPGEAYGFCLQKKADFQSPNPGAQPRNWQPVAATAYAALKDGTVREIVIYDRNAREYWSSGEREWKLATQIEGCVTDPATGILYVGEENRGIWRIDVNAYDPRPELIAEIGEEDGLVADVEGLAILPRAGRSALLIASSQGDNAYAVFDTADGRFLGRFRVARGRYGSTEETDGIEVMAGSFGEDFPDGLFVAQDGANEPEAQNFKLVSWERIARALGLN